MKVLFFFILLIVSFQSSAKSKIPYLSISNRNDDEVYDHLKCFLLEKEYFVLTIDSNQAFVQVRIIPKHKGVFLKASQKYDQFLVDF